MFVLWISCLVFGGSCSLILLYFFFFWHSFWRFTVYPPICISPCILFCFIKSYRRKKKKKKIEYMFHKALLPLCKGPCKKFVKAAYSTKPNRTGFERFGLFFWFLVFGRLKSYFGGRRKVNPRERDEEDEFAYETRPQNC